MSLGLAQYIGAWNDSWVHIEETIGNHYSRESAGVVCIGEMRYIETTSASANGIDQHVD